MLRYLLAFGLVAVAAGLEHAAPGHFAAHGAPTPLDISLASGIYTVAMGARVRV